MAVKATGINPLMLRWARETARYSLGDAARALGKPPEFLAACEAGEESPTYVQLETLAYKVYKRPVALFFFPEPPDEWEPEEAFRTLPDFEKADLSPDTRFKVRKAQAYQISLRELNDGENPGDRLIFREFSFGPGDDPREAARAVREYLSVTIAEQVSWRSSSDAFARWRDAVEGAGLFVFKDTFQQKDVSGFCLADAEFPIIYINNGTSFARQSFTLFHELGHLLENVSGVAKRDDRFIDALRGADRRIEVFCNRFAAELLVPSDHFDKTVPTGSHDDEAVADIADLYSVSREVILRRLLDRGDATQREYEEKTAAWSEDYLRTRQERAGGNYYRTQVSYLGKKYLNLAFSKFYQGAIGVDALADHLNVKAANIPQLEQYALT